MATGSSCAWPAKRRRGLPSSFGDPSGRHTRPTCSETPGPSWPSRTGASGSRSPPGRSGHSGCWLLALAAESSVVAHRRVLEPASGDEGQGQPAGIDQPVEPTTAGHPFALVADGAARAVRPDQLGTFRTDGHDRVLVAHDDRPTRRAATMAPRLSSSASTQVVGSPGSPSLPDRWKSLPPTGTPPLAAHQSRGASLLR